MTIKDIDLLWEKLTKGYGVEQHDFVKLIKITSFIKPYYDDLHEHWNEEHAILFAKVLNEKVFPTFGILDIDFK